MNFAILFLNLLASLAKARDETTHSRRMLNQDEGSLHTFESTTDNVGALVMSKTCKTFREVVGIVNLDSTIANEAPEDIANYICGTIGRKFLQGKMDGLRQVTDTSNACAMDLMELLASDAVGVVDEAIADEAFCRAEIMQKIAVIA